MICSQIAKKAKRETLPSTSLYSERSKASDATHEILREAEYKDASDPDITITPEERVKAYKVIGNNGRSDDHSCLNLHFGQRPTESVISAVWQAVCASVARR